jgi:drug/metabolite transporter (DMT)-like permease
MNPKLMIWISVILSAVAQVFLKQGLSKLQSVRSSNASILDLAGGVVCQGFIWLWGICFIAATGLWLVGLRNLELSYAYPLVSFGYVLVNILSAIFFNEHVDRQRWLSVAVICAGIFFIAGS